MSLDFKTVSAASGHVSRAVFMRAVRRAGFSSESEQIADEVFIKGYRQATVARHFGVSRQRVHAVCRELLEEINRITRGRSSDEKVVIDHHVGCHHGRMRVATASQPSE